MAAMQVGRLEASAALNLLQNIPEEIVERLTTMVKPFTMIKFINHDCLAHGWFNRDEQLANSSQAAWRDILVNSTDSLTLLRERLSADFLSINQKLRKPWSSATVEPLSRVCALFAASRRLFVAKFPSDFVSAEIGKIDKAFQLKHADCDLMAMMSDSVPPIDLERVGVFRSAVKKFERKAFPWPL
ncbi:unnamed protein product [Durusdinium trenchii]|uniref:Uncharacterized protein n=1 Tax=Durusdinium trenchii TaxID=1381693 RepID=A0ABP0HTL3_9DINO